MKKTKITWIVIYCLMTLWWFYQINVLPNGFQRYFIMFLAFLNIGLILMKTYDVKPLFGKKKHTKE